MPLVALREIGLVPRLLAPPSTGYVYQVPNLLRPSLSNPLFEFFTSRFDGWRVEVDAFGLQQRATAYFADDGCTFSYVGLTLRPKPWPDALAAARERVSLVAAAHGTKITAVCTAATFVKPRVSLHIECGLCAWRSASLTIMPKATTASRGTATRCVLTAAPGSFSPFRSEVSGACFCGQRR